jgi:hypothetical protein
MPWEFQGERYMKRSNGVIPAEVGSGNLAIKAKFDAVLWFEKARPMRSPRAPILRSRSR